MVSIEEALDRVRLHVRNANLVKHMIAVSSIMRGLAERLGEEPELWGAVGMLHDIDYEEVGEDWERHGLLSAEMVSDILPEEALHAIKAHNQMTGVKAERRMDVALIAADALSGLVVATALMMPGKRLEEVKVSSLRRKFKDGSFARGVSRDNIMRCEELGIKLDEFFEIGLGSMRKVAADIGL
ncbi:HD domain-containing protein [Candidatus Bathyarchaeota archaeon]|nr:HD domain-containing protein [Candidatus Bathyarchaeota archaeon]